MSAIPKHKMTMEEYIEFDKNNEGRWEYFDGEVVDMAGGSLNHNRIAKNILTVLDNKLDGTPCEALPSDMRLKVPKALPYRYPDVVVVCGEPVIETVQGQEMLVNPLLIVEVLSPSTIGRCVDKFTLPDRKQAVFSGFSQHPLQLEGELINATPYKAYDFDTKFTAYQSIGSFKEYLLVAQDRPHVTKYARQPDGQWLRKDIEETEGVVKLSCMDCELTFDEIYRLVNFPPVESVIRPV